jgi:competence protein ComEA
MRGVAALTCLILLSLAPAAAAQPPTAGAAQLRTELAPAAVTNLNTATLAQLQKLPGIGPRTAERILEYRQKNGGFKKIEELMNIRGIGEKSFLKIKPQITVSPARVNAP